MVTKWEWMRSHKEGSIEGEGKKAQHTGTIPGHSLIGRGRGAGNAC